MRLSRWLMPLALGCGGDDIVGSAPEPDPAPVGCFDSSDVGQITVDGTHGFTSLQSALDAAVAGSDLLLCPGFHVGNFVAHAPVNIRSLDGHEQTVLAGAGGATLTIPGGSELVGLTIQSGTPGLLMSSPGALRIEDSLITDNHADHGAGLVIPEAAEVTLVGTRVSDNLAWGRGGGVWVQPGATLELTENSSVEANWAGEFGAGVWLEGAHLRGGMIKDNLLLKAHPYMPIYVLEAEGFGGSGVALTGTGSIVGTEIAWNQGEGGALSVSHGTATLDEVWVHDNDGRLGIGGGLGVAASTVIGNGTSRFEQNVSQFGGGGLVVDSTLRGLSFTGNTAGSDGSLAEGGGLYVSNGILEDVVSSRNQAMSGAGVYAVGNLQMVRVSLRDNESQWTGGGVHLGSGRGAPFEITDCEFVGNTASEGAGLYSTHPSVVVTNADITGNVATSIGGGLYVKDGEVELAGGRVTANQASSGGGAYVAIRTSLSVAGTDFGQGEEDNSPDDVENASGGPVQGLGSDATFFCDGIQCTTVP